MVARELRLEDFINRGVMDSAPDYARVFQQAQPFRHVVIDDFLTPEFCTRICDQFPPFETAHAINENEQVGGKSTREKVRSLGSAFIDADDLMQYPEFLAMIELITGVRELQYDPFYFGGGTHENCEGQDLDPHIDFNYHPVTSQHRRLNLIIYLNQDWSEDWGGALQLHRDPYLEPEQDEIVTVIPAMNRCVIFETSEHSWHGFEQIVLPDENSHLTRKSFAVYFYTDLRPEAETAVQHSTVYVERHLPEKFSAGMVLDAVNIRELRQILYRRDMHLKRLYKDIQSLGGELNRIRYSGGGKALKPLTAAEIPEDLRSAVRMIQILHTRLHDMEASTSWRLTAPIRTLKRLVAGKS